MVKEDKSSIREIRDLDADVARRAIEIAYKLIHEGYEPDRAMYIGVARAQQIAETPNEAGPEDSYVGR
jgi:uncharacterized protein YdaT